MRLEFCWVSHASLVGDNKPNQDNLLLIDGQGRATQLIDGEAVVSSVPNWPAEHFRLAVMDGLGSLSHSRQTTELLALALQQIKPQADATALGERIDECHHTLRQQLQSKSKQGGCTLSLLDINPSGKAHLCHVGDSRLYQLAPRPQCLTLDHSPPTYYACHSLLDQQQWHSEVFGSNQSKLLQAIGAGSRWVPGGEQHPDLFALAPAQLPNYLAELADRRTIELQNDCYYLLATDGLWDLLEPESSSAAWPALARQAHNSQALLNKLIRHSTRQTQLDREHCRCGDNTTAIVFSWRTTDGLNT